MDRLPLADQAELAVDRRVAPRRLTGDRDLAPRRGQEPGHHVQHGGLAGPVGPEQPGDPRPEGHRHIVDGDHVAVPPRHSIQDNDSSGGLPVTLQQQQDAAPRSTSRRPPAYTGPNAPMSRPGMSNSQVASPSSDAHRAEQSARPGDRRRRRRTFRTPTSGEVTRNTATMIAAATARRPASEATSSDSDAKIMAKMVACPSPGRKSSELVPHLPDPLHREGTADEHQQHAARPAAATRR